MLRKINHVDYFYAINRYFFGTFFIKLIVIRKELGPVNLTEIMYLEDALFFICAIKETGHLRSIWTWFVFELSWIIINKCRQSVVTPIHHQEKSRCSLEVIQKYKQRKK